MAKKSLFAIDLEEDNVFDDKSVKTKEVETPQVKQDVKYCAKCKSQNAISAKFCGECGSNEFVDNLEVLSKKYCLSCGLELDVSVKFCYDCGNNTFAKTREEYDKAQKEKEFIPYKEEISRYEEEINKIKPLIKELNYEIQRLNKELEHIKIPTVDNYHLPKEFKGDIAGKQKLELEIKKYSDKIQKEMKELELAKEAFQNNQKLNATKEENARKVLEEKEKIIHSIEEETKKLKGGF